jgi:hypothetical protein
VAYISIHGRRGAGKIRSLIVALVAISASHCWVTAAPAAGRGAARWLIGLPALCCWSNGGAAGSSGSRRRDTADDTLSRRWRRWAGLPAQCGGWAAGALLALLRGARAARIAALSCWSRPVAGACAARVRRRLTRR